MKMKILILLVIVWGTLGSSWSQGKLSAEKHKEFEAQKIAYFTHALELTPEEAAGFWPLYNEMVKKVREQEEKLRKVACETQKTGQLKEAQEKQQVSDLLECEQKMLDIKKEYYQKLLKVVPPRKVVRLDRVERKFHEQLLRKMYKERDDHR